MDHNEPSAGAPAGDSTGEATNARTTSDLRPQAHGGALAPAWRPGQSGNPAGRPRRDGWTREWLWTLWANHGAAQFAEAVKKGDPWALRLLADRILGAPPADDVDPEADLPADLDLAAADAAVAPPPAPRSKTARERAEEEVLAEAEREGRYRDASVRRLMVNLSEDEFTRRVTERLRRAEGQDGRRA
jgi:hypothetical protein